jgi:hypothetical protein
MFLPFQVTIEYPNAGLRKYHIQQKFAEIVRLIASGNEQSVLDCFFKLSSIREAASKEYMNIIREELKVLCNKDTPSVLRKKEYKDLNSFTWINVLKEWESLAPNFVKFLFTCSENPSQLHNKLKTRESIIPSVVSAGCKLLHIYNRDLSAFQDLQSISLLRGGGKNFLFKRQLAIGDCTSYQTTLDRASKFGDLWNVKLLDWKEQIEKQTSSEMEIKREIEHVQLLSKECDPASILYLGKLKDRLTDLQRYVHPGFSVVGDNVDLRTHARHTTRTYKDRDEHMFQLNAVKNRIANPCLDMWKAKQNPHCVPFADICPRNEDVSKLQINMAFLVARIWIKYIPWLTQYSNCIPGYISHEYMSESRKKTEKASSIYKFSYMHDFK